MTWGVIVDVPAPVEVYDALHAALLERTGGSLDGLLVHLALETETGFQVIEVWESQADYDRAMADVLTPIMRDVSGGEHSEERPDAGRPFAVRGIVLPRAQIAV